MPASSDPRIDQWVSLSDFTAGIYNNSYIAGSDAIVPVQKPAADARYTVGCMALPNGGLGPLPKVTTAYEYPTKSATPATQYLVGFINTPLANTHADEFLTVVEGEGTRHLLQVRSFYPDDGAWNHVYTVTSTPTSGFFCAPFPQMTRMAKATPTTKPGQPVVVFPTSIVKSGLTGTGQLWVYPTLTSPTTYKMKNLITTGKITGQVLVHQGRVVVLTGIGYSWPGTPQFQTNEQICYTTPSNSDTYGTQEIVLAPEYPYGYGCGGSISAGELFLVKKRGGGLVMTGDLNFPTVTFLPGVEPTGDFYGNAASTPAGLFYCSTHNGAWLWNGGNVSQKVSQNLDDNFFVCPTPVPNQNNLGFYCQSWGEWILFSNNWIYNMRLQSWWRMPGSTFFFYQSGRTAQYMYAGVQKIKAPDNYFAYKMDRTIATSTWVWQSLPMKLDQNRYINIREIVIYASNPTSGNSTIKVNIYNGSTTVFSYQSTAGAIGVDPTMLRVPVGAVTLQNAIIRITGNCAATGAAPILHSLTFGIRTRQHVETL